MSCLEAQAYDVVNKKVVGRSLQKYGVICIFLYYRIVPVCNFNQ